ncbi:Glycylpeptide N-tetradecanoyltransferase [Nemania sp. FL0031]|nr:Glycylpeptide N-tetradecanoyltransferase [Nemania sp. FL0031]
MAPRPSHWAIPLGISLGVPIGLYAIFLFLASFSFFQRHFFYAHRLNTLFWHDLNKPEYWGFARNQVTPFTLPSGNESLYAWHILPLKYFLKHEDTLHSQPSGYSDNITTTESFKILKDDPDAQLIISYTSSFYVLTIDYRGYGKSTGFPSEDGLIQDGVAALDWAMNAAGVSSDRIIVMGHSLGTAVASGVAQHYAVRGIEFAGVILIAGFSNVPTLLSTYSGAGFIPVLSPLRPIPPLLRLFQSFIVDKWDSANRLADVVRLTRKRLRLTLIHAKNDLEIPCHESDALFRSAASATIGQVLDDEAFLSWKKQRTTQFDDGTFVSTVMTEPDIVIRQELVAFGGHNGVIMSSAVALAVMRTGASPRASEQSERIVKSTYAPNHDAEASPPSKGKGKEKEKAAKKLHKAIDGLSNEQVTQLLDLNPALATELANGSDDTPEAAAEALRRLNLQDIMTGLASSGKNVKDMGAYKFWATQPVPKFGEDQNPEQPFEEGPIKVQTVDEISKNPPPLVDGFEWATLDLLDDAQLKEVWELLNGHYVEDDEAMFRFNYSTSILKWAMMPPGWKKQWHRGVRASQSRKLVAFIAAIPVELRIRDKTLHASEVNFLCIHKKLRSKRLAPVLIKEITRLCNLEGVFQAIYTGGIVLPKPVSTCRYYHRAINWQKLYDVGFSPLPANSKPQFQIRKYAVPERTSIRGLREMQKKDIAAVQDLLTRYLAKYDMAATFDKHEVEHWLLHNKKDAPEDQVVWTYVVEDEHHKITDFVSFYCLESSVINHPKHSNIKAAYLFYYATEVGLASPVDRDALKARLNALVSDSLVYCKQYKFDVYNALSLMDNGLFLEDQKFGPGDGQLHYYLFNYRANPIAGGVDKRNRLDIENLSGIGYVS